MRTFSILAFLLALGILGCSIYGGQMHHSLPFAIMSGILGWATWPEKKQVKPYRSYRSWEHCRYVMAEEFSKVWSGLNKVNLTPPRVEVRGRCDTVKP